MEGVNEKTKTYINGLLLKVMLSGCILNWPHLNFGQRGKEE
jgi:hypothetical protein